MFTSRECIDCRRRRLWRHIAAADVVAIGNEVSVCGSASDRRERTVVPARLCASHAGSTSTFCCRTARHSGTVCRRQVPADDVISPWRHVVQSSATSTFVLARSSLLLHGCNWHRRRQVTPAAVHCLLSALPVYRRQSLPDVDICLRFLQPQVWWAHVGLGPSSCLTASNIETNSYYYEVEN